jgi:hypothetical protein
MTIEKLIRTLIKKYPSYPSMSGSKKKCPEYLMGICYAKPLINAQCFFEPCCEYQKKLTSTSNTMICTKYIK